MKQIRRLFTLAAMTATLGVVPLAGSTATATADTVNWDAIAQCESGGNWSTDTGNGHYGGLQFKQSTWSTSGGIGSPAHATREQQIRVAENVLAKQGLNAWPTCGTRGYSPTFSAPTYTTGSGCQQFGVLLGVVDLGRLCTTLTNPGQAITSVLTVR